MLQSRLRISLHDELAVAAASRAHPEVELSVLGAIPSDGAGAAVVRVAGPDLEGFLAAMRAGDAAERVRILERGAEVAILELESAEPEVLFAARGAGTPIEFPVRVRDGTATVTVAGPRERVAALTERLRSLGLEYDVDDARSDPGASRLTDRQREVVLAAVEEGYYDTPRRCTLTELADELGIAKSTCSETLHRAEETIVKRYA
ncbi:helix-turn-helix domain-containing protein [Halovivax sp.]|uniref:helix-turn-helix domain-containing protein n=1 Tax=Halovivax sp. TaxID=1935978 RepID=UPI0025BB209D|nr:helix-turn-helix domain-containing protein [Halovivax sp.]